MENNNVFLIVSMNDKASSFLKESLDRVLGEELEIYEYSFLKSGIDILKSILNKNPKVIMATGVNSYNTILKYCNESNIIMGDRDISEPEYVDKLFLIPNNEKVLVVNETLTGAYETIESITNLGITHLKYIPYWKDSSIDVSDIKYAITPGMLNYCPASIQNKIDIGMRNLSINSFKKILDAYSLDSKYLDIYSRQHKKVLIDTYKKLSYEYKRSNSLNKSFEKIIDIVDEAIIAINNFNLITNVNYMAEKLFNADKSKLINKDIYDILVSYSDLTKSDNIFELKKIINLADKQVYVTYVPLENDINVGILKFRRIQDIQNSEENVRKLIYETKKGYSAKHTFEDLLSPSVQMNEIIEKAKVLARTNSNILITGESGTGKEIFTQSIHNYSLRANGPFVAVNFAALPENLIESELFGYEEGAFTGAKKSGKKGLFEQAHRGTIFLDEIGDASSWVQSRLLRVLEEKEIMRIGDNKIIPIDIRVIAATNKNLKELTAQGKFREDLYYRLNVFHLHIPPLRERKESIINIAASLLKKYNDKKYLSDDVLKIIVNYKWPGNIRELKNFIEYVATISKSNMITPEDFPYDMMESSKTYADNTTDINESDKKDDNGMNSNSDIYAVLGSLFDIKYIMSILSIIRTYSSIGINAGRAKIIQSLNTSGINIAESELRRILKIFSDLELISIGKTKQGCLISDKGNKFLNEYPHMI